MELEELKQAWSQYDKHLKANLIINQELLRNMNIEKSKKEMQIPMKYEIFSVVILFLTVCVFSGFSVKFISELKFSIPGFSGVILVATYLTFAILKVNKFVKIQYYKSSIITLQKDLNKLKALVLKLRKFELFLLPLLIISVLPIAFKAIHNIDIFMNLKLFVFEIAAILGVSYPVGYWINKHLYDNKIKDVNIFLSEIEAFEKDN